MTAKKTEAEAKKKKLCFVIGPIGYEGSETRDKADWLLFFIKQTVEPMGYVVKRADEISEPGSITHQIINAIYEAELVIADLTGHNANAFYELAIRHSVQKPVIHMIEEEAPIPFDIKDHRTIFYSPSNPRKMLVPMAQLVEQIKETEKADFKVSNPISQALTIRKMEASPDEQSRMIAGLVNRIDDLEDRVINKSYADTLRRDAQNTISKNRQLGEWMREFHKSNTNSSHEYVETNGFPSIAEAIEGKKLYEMFLRQRQADKLRLEGRMRNIKEFEEKNGEKHPLAFHPDMEDEK